MASLIVLTAVVLLSQQPQPAAPQPARGTAILRGQITDAENRLPIPRAVITATLHMPESPPFVIQNVADVEGRFELLNLIAGGYQVSATSGEYRASHVRETFPPLASGATMAVMLRDGEVKSDINIALRRALAISGRVIDEFGDAVVGVDVQLSSAPGRPHGPHRSRSTDDRGRFRLFGIPPGQYVVCARVRQSPSAPNVAVVTRDRFVTTCHPSALDQSEAQVVTVNGIDVDGIEIRIRRLRLLSVSGVVMDSTGAVARSPLVTFRRYEGDGVSGSTRVAPDGQFRFSGLGPGDYSVEALIVDSAAAPHAVLREHGYISLKLDEHDVADLVVSMKIPARVQGRVMFEDGPPASGSVGEITVSAWSETRRFQTPIRPVRVASDLSFTLNDLSGSLRLSLQGLPRGWVLKSIRYNGLDITNTATEFVTDSRHQIEVAVTSRVAIVSGSVTDDGGRPAARACVILSSTIPTQTIGGGIASPALSITSQDGRFTLPGVAAGDYLLVALPCRQYDALRQRRATNEALMRHAERVSLIENDRLTMSPRLVTLPER